MSDLKEVADKATSVKSILVTLTALFAVISSIVAGYGFLDSKYAKADDLRALENRIDIAELKTSLRTALEEYYFLRQQLRKYPDDVELQDRVKEAKEQVDELKKQIELREKASQPD